MTSVLAYDRNARFQPDVDGAALVYNGALSGNWFNDILGGHQLQIANKTPPGRVY